MLWIVWDCWDYFNKSVFRRSRRKKSVCQGLWFLSWSWGKTWDTHMTGLQIHRIKVIRGYWKSMLWVHTRMHQALKNDKTSTRGRNYSQEATWIGWYMLTHPWLSFPWHIYHFQENYFPLKWWQTISTLSKIAITKKHNNLHRSFCLSGIFSA